VRGVAVRVEDGEQCRACWPSAELRNMTLLFVGGAWRFSFERLRKDVPFDTHHVVVLVDFSRTGGA
jgi:hypothetical protein